MLDVCVLRFLPITKHNDQNLVEGRGVFKVTDEIASLDFAVTHASPYICRTFCRKAAKATCSHQQLETCRGGNLQRVLC